MSPSPIKAAYSVQSVKPMNSLASSFRFVLLIRPEGLFRKRVLINFANFTGKHLCWSLFHKNANANLLKETRVLPVTFAKFLISPFCKKSVNEQGRKQEKQEVFCKKQEVCFPGDFLESSRSVYLLIL